jgi:hypothetical protein
MMKKRACILFIALLMLLSAFAYAQTTTSAFFVGVEAVNDKIMDPADDFAEFVITVENKGSETDTFKLLYLEDPKWSYQVLPGPASKQIDVAPGEAGEIRILVKGNVDPGRYSVKVSVQSMSTGNILDNVMRIGVGKSAPGVPPDPDFDVDVSVPAQMDPRGTYNVVVDIKNNNELLLEDVNIKLASKFITEDTLVTVEPNEAKSISFAVLLMENIKPQEDQLHVTVNHDGVEFYSADHNFEVVEYVLPFDTRIDVDKRMLKQVRTITITNKGNTLKSDTVRLETSLKEKFFSRATPKFKAVKEDGRYFFAWDVSLEPEESMTITLTTSYRLLLLLALVIIAILAYRIAMSNPLIVKKKIMSVHKEHGGAISDLSVVMLLRNRGNEPITKLRVIERVSSMVKLKKDSFAGSMHPVKMHEHSKEGTLLEYRFGELAPGDERIIKYKVYSKLHIFGTLSIKPTVVEFFKKGNIKKSSCSREVSITTEERVPKTKPMAKKHPEHKKEKHGSHKHSHSEDEEEEAIDEKKED